MLPIIPKLPNGQYDYKTLTTKLKEIKSNPDNADETKANFNADANIPYDIVDRDPGRHEAGRGRQGPVPRRRLRGGDSVMADALDARDRPASRARRRSASYARKLAEPEVIKDLNITPMMDMMTIILVFLLKSFSSTTSTITFDQNLQVPKSITQLKPKLAVTVTVTKKVILVEGDAIAPINAGRVDPAVKRDGENGYYITPLVDILEKHARREKKVAEHDRAEVRGPADARRRPDHALPPADRGHLLLRPGRLRELPPARPEGQGRLAPRAAGRPLRAPLGSTDACAPSALPGVRNARAASRAVP